VVQAEFAADAPADTAWRSPSAARCIGAAPRVNPTRASHQDWYSRGLVLETAADLLEAASRTVEEYVSTAKMRCMPMDRPPDKMLAKIR
jgi:hypothetical protein